MSRQQRMDSRDENVLDRRKLSENSRRALAETIHHGDTDAALSHLFEILTGDPVSNHPPKRSVSGSVSITDTAAAALPANGEVVVDVTVGADTVVGVVDETTSTQYTTGLLTDGEYIVSASVNRVVVRDPDTLSETVYEVLSSTVSPSSGTVTVDSTTVAMGTPCGGPSVTIDALDVGGAL